MIIGISGSVLVDFYQFKSFLTKNEVWGQLRRHLGTGVTQTQLVKNKSFSDQD